MKRSRMHFQLLAFMLVVVGANVWGGPVELARETLPAEGSAPVQVAVFSTPTSTPPGTTTRVNTSASPQTAITDSFRRTQSVPHHTELNYTGRLSQDVPGYAANQEIIADNIRGEFDGDNAHVLAGGLRWQTTDGKPIEVIRVGKNYYVHGPAPSLELDESGWVVPYDIGDPRLNPIGYAQIFPEFLSEDLDGAARVGVETLDGVSCDIYTRDRRATITTFLIWLELPPEQEYIDLFEEADTRYWVCQDGYLRQITLSFQFHEKNQPERKQTTVVKIRYSNLNVPVTIKAPSLPPRKITIENLPLVSQWTFSTPDPIRRIALAPPNAILVRTENNLFAVDTQNGETLWQIPLEPYSTKLQVDGNIVYAEQGAGLKALALSDGHLLWQIQEQVAGIQSVEYVIDAGRLYVLWRGDGSIRAYSSRDGTLLWSSSVPDCWGFNYGISNNTMIARGERIFVLCQNSIVTMDAASGAFVSRTQDEIKLDDWSRILEDTVYTDVGMLLEAREPGTGRLRWKLESPNKSASEFNVVAGRLYVRFNHWGTSGGLVGYSIAAIDPDTGQLIWEQELEDGPRAPVALLDKIIYVLLVNGSVSGLDAGTGKPVGTLRYSVSSTSTYANAAALATDGDLLFVTFGDTNLFALGK